MIVFHSRNDPLVRTSNGLDMTLCEPIEFVDDKGNRYRAPIGATTDGASIVKFLWSLGLAPFGIYWLACVIHDIIYRRLLELWNNETQTWRAAPVNKEFADNVLNDCMRAIGVPDALRLIIHEGVVYGGERAWIEDGKV